MTPQTLDRAKAELRRFATLRRDAAAAAVAGAAAAVAERFFAAVRVPPGAAVSGFWPMRSEIDPRPILTELGALGHPFCLPVVVGKGRPLVFRAWRPGDALVAGDFGTQVPDAGQPDVVPRVLLVPLLAFDRNGYRLGYGGGFYDRTLAMLRAAGPALAVGLAVAAQEVESVPHDAMDARLDGIVTEAETVDLGMGRT